MIFSMIGMINFVIFIATYCLFPVFIAFFIGKISKINRLEYILPIITLLLPITWALIGFVTFNKYCSSSATPANHSKTVVTQDIEFIEDSSFRQGDDKYGDYSRLKSSTFNFYKKLNTEYSLFKGQYTITVFNLKKLNVWWAPSIYRQDFQINEIASGKLIVNASDIIYGGGLLGVFTRIIGGDQDYSLLSCGYASNNVGVWRPTLTTQIRFKQYENADRKFLNNLIQ